MTTASFSIRPQTGMHPSHKNCCQYPLLCYNILFFEGEDCL